MAVSEGYVDLGALVGQTFTSVERKPVPYCGYGCYDEPVTEVHFIRGDGRRYVMGHDQDCCERVDLVELVGDLDDLVGQPILDAYEESKEAEAPDADESGTWTFYRIATIKGTVTLRWLGQSNGYYSESVDVWIESESDPATT